MSGRFDSARLETDRDLVAETVMETIGNPVMGSFDK
jgi:hypothetical protein